ncbi:hypothetical protein FB107DRAFT_294151 [Schizophyllum commune]
MGRKKRAVLDAPTRTLRPRNVLTGRALTLKEREAYRAAQEQERLLRLRTPPQSVRSAPSDASRSSPARSLADSEVSEYLPPPSTPSWKPRRPREIGWLSPKQRAIPYTRPNVNALRLVAPMGDQCPFTGRERGDRTVQVCHGVDKATKSPELRTIEKFWGLGPNEFFVNSRLNCAFLGFEIHVAWDANPGKILVIPTMSDLQKMHIALTRKIVRDWPFKDREPHKNADGFIHYEEVFPFNKTGYYHRIVPLLHWGTSGIPCMIEYPDGSSRQDTIQPPFRLHVNPYNMVWKANKVLKGQDDSVVPAYALAEVTLIRRIGAIMSGIVNPDAADFAP